MRAVRSPLSRQYAHSRFLALAGFFVVYTALLYGVLSPEWSTFALLVPRLPGRALCRGPRGAGDHRLAARRAAGATALLGFLVAFALTSDFNPRHLVQAGSDAVAFRTGPFAAHALTWYRRLDVESPAAFVERTVEPDATTVVVVENLPPLSHYLDMEHAIYYVREGQRYRITSRERGTREIWSGMPLLSTPAELADYSRDARDVWLIREVERFPLLPEPEAVWGERLRRREQVFVSRDGRVEVLHLELAPPASGRPAGRTSADAGAEPENGR